jgi:protein TonB
MVRAGAYALSAGAHIAIAFVTFGQPSSVQGTPQAPTEISIESVDVPAEPPKPEPEPEPEPVNNVKAVGSPTPATHTHDYPVPLDHDAHPHDPNAIHAPVAHDDDHAEKAEPVVATAPAATFTMKITTSGATAGTPNGTGNAVASGPSGDAVAVAPVAESAVSVQARLIGSVNPAYPPSARQNEIEADVALEIIVAPDGRVIDARVTKPAGYGFDAAAIQAVRAARFTPALLNGKAVPVRMRWSVAFRLR